MLPFDAGAFGGVGTDGAVGSGTTGVGSIWLAVVSRAEKPNIWRNSSWSAICRVTGLATVTCGGAGAADLGCDWLCPQAASAGERIHNQVDGGFAPG